ncbi:MAG: hypothetical protein LBJ36_07310 [Synergistaceae bacterium]|jgi:uncharacterized membrane protein YcgQ (UPF0703/DUF1980 family)|nr:hypothetical protein [Synergistaceae bacterium]
MKYVPKKELFIALVGVAFMALTFPNQALFASTPEQSAENPKIFEIREKMFIQQCNDIYLNPDEYLGRMVKLEGIYEEYTDKLDDEVTQTFRYVIRYGPGCCGNDGVAGFQVLFDGDPAPKQDDWVEAVGTVELDNQGEEASVVLRLSHLEVMQKRGAEFVKN